jgi:PAS domain S-box-containing protein
MDTAERTNDSCPMEAGPDFRTLFETSPRPYLLLAADFTIIAASQGYLQTMGMTQKEILGRDIFEIFPGNPDLSPAAGTEELRASLNHVIQNQTPHTMEARQFDVLPSKPEGSPSEERYWRPVNSPVIGGDARLECILHQLDDVTEFIKLKEERHEKARQAERLRGRMEEVEWEVHLRVQEQRKIADALQDSQARLQSIFSQVAVGIAQTDLEGGFVLVNHKYCDMVGRSEGELLKMRMQEITHPEDLPANMERFKKLLVTREEYVIEKRYVRPDGSNVWAEVSVSMVSDSSGKPSHLVAVVLDITERKRIEKEAVARARQQQVVTELSQYALAAGDLESLFERAAKALADELGVEFTQILELLPSGAELLLKAGVGWKPGLVGRARMKADLRSEAGYTLNPGQRVVGKRLANPEPVMVEDLQTERRFRPLQLQHEHGVVSGMSVIIYGSVRPYGVLGAHSKKQRLFSQEDGRFLQAVANVLAAAIQRKRAEEKLRESTDRLKTLSQRLLEVQEVERRNMARALHDEVGQALTAVELNLQNAKEQCSEAVMPRLDEGLRIIEGVLERVKNFSLDLRPTMLDDIGLAAALRWYTHQQAKLSKISAVVDCERLQKRLDAQLETACFRIAQEAITNIIRHAHAQWIRIELRQRESELQLSIRDNGRGFDVAQARGKVGPDTSLGLVGMEERASLAGGTVEVRSSAEGTEVLVRFPVVQKRPSIHA